MKKVFHTIILIQVMFIYTVAYAQSHDLVVTQIAPLERNIYLLPGEETEVSWQVSNNESSEISHLYLAFNSSEYTLSRQSEYSFESLTPDVCGAPLQLDGGFRINLVYPPP